MARPIPFVDVARQHRPLKARLLRAAARVIAHGQFILGPEVALFEKRLAAFCGARYAVGVGNGTDALRLALQALGIGPGDEVITAANSFVATASAIALSGARPVLADVRDDFNIDPAAAARAVSARTKAIIPVHLTGRPAAMDELRALARERGLKLVEDCAQAIGAEYRGRRVGALGELGCFSLHPLKTLSACGDGGAVVTDDEALYERLRLLRNLGLPTRDECVEIGPNSRLDTLQAALLLVKLGSLRAWSEARRRHAALYRRELAGLAAVRCPTEAAHERAVYHTFIIEAERRDELKAFLAARGIGSAIHYPLPIHLQRAFAGYGWRRGEFPVSERQAARILSLPVYPELTPADLRRVAAAVREFYR